MQYAYVQDCLSLFPILKLQEIQFPAIRVGKAANDANRETRTTGVQEPPAFVLPSQNATTKPGFPGRIKPESNHIYVNDHFTVFHD